MENLELFWACILTRIIENKCVGTFERDQQESVKTLCDKSFSSLEFLVNLLASSSLDFLFCLWWSKMSIWLAPGKSICSEGRSFYLENYLVSSIKLSLIRMSHPLVFCNVRVTSWTQGPERLCVCPGSWHKATVTHTSLCREDMSHANPWKCLFLVS